MRKLALGAALACALLLAGCDVASMSSLSELTEPYAGTYECTALTLGGEDLLPRFEKIGLELKGGEFVLTCRPLSGEEGKLRGAYSVSPEGDGATFRVTLAGREYVRAFRREAGAIYVDENVGGRLLHAEFRMP